MNSTPLINQEQITSLVRQALLAAGGGLVTHGYVSSDGWTQLASGLAVLLVTSAWALYTRRRDGLVASAAAQPAVQKIVMTDAASAAAIPVANVVGPAKS